MEREEEKPKAFTVNDRRRFSSEGDLKPEFRESADPARRRSRHRSFSRAQSAHGGVCRRTTRRTPILERA